MAFEARIPLRRALAVQPSRLVVTADSITVELRGWGRVFRTPWSIPRSQVAVVDPTLDEFDLDAGPAWIWSPRLVVPELRTGRGKVNLRLLFRSPQRVPVVRRGGPVALSASRSRSVEGLRLDGVGLTAKDPREAAETLRAFGYETTDRPIEWLRRYHAVSEEPAVVAAAVRSDRRRSRLGLIWALTCFVIAAVVHTVGDGTLSMVIVGVAVVVIFGGDKVLNGYLDRRDRRDSVS